MAWLNKEQILKMGFAKVGGNVFISDKASFYGCQNISIGNNVRIDDFCVLSAGKGGIIIGDYIHIAINASLIGAGKIVVSDYCSISSRVSIYSSNDDYSGYFMTNPMIPTEFTSVYVDDVILEKHVIIGSSSIILPGVVLEEGVAIGALSLVKERCKSFCLYAGRPARFLKKRSTNLLKFEEKLKLLQNSN
jgi:galactoside O-acetyltransferase